MKIHRLPSNKKLYSFGDDLAVVPILNTTLFQYQESVCNSIGLKITPVESIEKSNEKNHCGRFEFAQSMVFNKGFLSAALEFIKRNKPTKNLQFSIKTEESLIRFSLPTTQNQDSWIFPFYYRINREDSFENVILEGKEFSMKLAIPKPIVPFGYYTTHQNEIFAAEIISPFHLLQANVGLNIGRTIPYPKIIPTFLFGYFSEPFSRFSRWGLKLQNNIGKNCKIHPSAVIEGCHLGDNVIVGANAVLRLSVIGDNTFIGDTAVVTFSIIGKNNYIMTGNHLQFCLTYESVFTIHGPYQFSIFGRNTAVFATINCDIRLDGKTISIPTENGILDSKQHLLGIAYGHNCKIGASNIIAAGRIVPNNTVLNPPEFIHLKFDDNVEN